MIIGDHRGAFTGPRNAAIRTAGPNVRALICNRKAPAPLLVSS